MEKDNEKIKELIKLSEENPDLPIITMVASEIFCSDDFSYWLGSIGEIKKDIVYSPNEVVMIGNDEIFDFIYEELENNIFNNLITEDMLQELTNVRIEQLKANNKIKMAIIVYIELP